MPRRSLGRTLLTLLVAPTALAGDARVDFGREVRPILAENCFHCHGPDEKERQGDLRLDVRDGALAVRNGKAAFTPKRPGDSEALRRILSSNPEEKMPPADSNRSLTPAQIDVLRRWVEQGAHWEQHWAYVSPKRPAQPRVQQSTWVRNPIDAFILARLEKEKLPPSPEAPRETLIRRVALDLTGLPPTPEQVDAFLADAAPDAYERLVDRLLASPRYGERMVWDWLEASRYADTNGYQEDRTRTMWPWRDWVVSAMNANMPFDQFTIEQLAGDLLAGAGLSQRIATGFNRNHMLNGEGGRIPEESRVEYVVDRVDATATIWLGLSMGCARCHDHKYDPFTQKEYYQLFAYFNNVDETGSVDRGGNAAPAIACPTSEQQAQKSRLTEAVAATDRELAGLKEQLRPGYAAWTIRAEANQGKLPEAIAAALKTSPDRRTEKQAKELLEFYWSTNPQCRQTKEKLDAARKQLEELEKRIPQTMVMQERLEPRETHVFIRGDYEKPGERVLPGVPASLTPLPPDASKDRLALARWIASGDNPLTARVAVNRAWQTFFGRGLVKTTEDFGVQGDPPTHPELLDWLATEFTHTGWDVKRLHRLIVVSATYRQSSKATRDRLERDPENRLLGRGARFRMPSFMLRDQALAVSGLLVEKIGGPPVKPYQPPGVWEDMSFGKLTYQRDSGENLYRRSLYTFWRRTAGPPSMFDSSARQVCTVRQPRTNTPLQALTMLNDETYVEAARVFAERMLKEGDSSPDARLTFGFRCATSRRPTAAELQLLTETLARLRERYQRAPEEAARLLAVGERKADPKLDRVELASYAGVASLLLNLDETVTRE